MKSALTLLVTAALLLCAAAAQAQLGSTADPQDFALIKSQPLTVVLKDEDPKELKKLAGQPEALAAYQSYVARYNAQLQELAPRLWKFSPAVEFRHATDLPALRKAKGGPRGVWQQAELVDVHHHQNLSEPAGVSNTGTYTYDHLSTFTLELYGDGSPRRVLFVSLAPGPTNASDLVFGLNSMQEYMQERLKGLSNRDVLAGREENAKLLATKILLINQAKLVDGLTAANIREVYPFPCEVVPYSTIEQAVASADARYAYIRVWPLTEDVVLQVAVDAATSKLLGRHTSYAVTKGSLKNFAKAASK